MNEKAPGGMGAGDAPATPTDVSARGAAVEKVIEAAREYRDFLSPHQQYPEPEWLKKRNAFIAALDALVALDQARGTEDTR